MRRIDYKRKKVKIMRCPFCNTEESKVIDSRPAEDGRTIRRRRECIGCMERFTTYEKIESVPIIIIKKDGTRQTFVREKVMNGLLRACEKRPISIEQLENVIDEIEAQINNSLKREVTSKEVGEMVIEKLKSLDEIAYVRFASVYRQFKDINSFVDELQKLLQSK